MRPLLSSLAPSVSGATRSRFAWPALGFAWSALGSALLLVGAASAQSEPLTADARALVIDQISSLLEEKYVFPETATTCAGSLRALAREGAFDECTERETFGIKLTEALRRASSDEHLLVRPRRRSETGKPEQGGLPARAQARRRDAGRQQNFGFEKVQRLEGNVGYLDLRYFAAPSDGIDTATAAMGFLANSDALIFDLRNNGGGSPGMVHFLSSYLFETPTHLNSFYYREGDRTEDYWTLPDVPGPKMAEVPVFVLMGPATFSAAEEFGYNLRAQRRGTLVGETTRGGANPGDLFPIDTELDPERDSGLEIFIPIGRAINPITGTNWEGIGVKPHVEVPAARALGMALELARPAAEAHRAALEARWERLEQDHAEANRAIGDAARALIGPMGMHAHNDYVHARPLLDSMAAGADSIEADVFLVDGRVLVAHDEEDCVAARSFRALYVEPLASLLEERSRAAESGPWHLFLLVDFKEDTPALLDALLADLEPLAPYLTRVQGEELMTKEITVVLSGDSPRKRVSAMAERCVFIDGRLPDLDENPDPRLVPFVSASWKSAFGPGLPERGSKSDFELRGIVDRAHQQGRVVRFWAAPDGPEAWRFQSQAGVDLIHTDTPARFDEFLRSVEPAAPAPGRGR